MWNRKKNCIYFYFLWSNLKKNRKCYCFWFYWWISFNCWLSCIENIKFGDDKLHIKQCESTMKMIADLETTISIVIIVTMVTQIERNCIENIELNRNWNIKHSKSEKQLNWNNKWTNKLKKNLIYLFLWLWK